MFAKTICPKKQREILRKDTLRISEAIVPRCSAKKISLKNSKIHRKISVLESLFKKVAQQRFFPANFAKLVRTPIL